MNDWMNEEERTKYDKMIAERKAWDEQIANIPEPSPKIKDFLLKTFYSKESIQNLIKKAEKLRESTPDYCDLHDAEESLQNLKDMLEELHGQY